MFQNDFIDPLDLPNYEPSKFTNFHFFDDTNKFFWDMIVYNNNMHRYI